jgi:hypothetical protein
MANYLNRENKKIKKCILAKRIRKTQKNPSFEKFALIKTSKKSYLPWQYRTYGEQSEKNGIVFFLFYGFPFFGGQ